MTFTVDKKKGGPGKEDQYTVRDAVPQPAWPADADFQYVGTRQPRVEGAEKVTGRAEYSYDIRLPGLLYGRILRSPHPHARIASIDTTAAEALPGVHAVLHHANTERIPWYEDSAVFDPHLRFVGEEVAAVAAESADIAADAVRLIEVEYEVLPFNVDFTRALEPGTPVLHGESNVAGEPKEYERGDAEAGLAEADVVVERDYTTQTALHNALEPHGCTARWEGDHLTLWDSTQSIFTVREQVAKALEIPEHTVRVIKQYMGGGFGAKQIAWKPDVIAALLAKRAGRPVQLMLDRAGENLSVGNRNPTSQCVRLGAKRDGTLTAISVEIIQGAGAHSTGGEASDVSGTYQTLYRCPNVKTTATAVFFNAGPAVAFRAPGHVEAAFALESAMDELARKLEMDPLALRLRNYVEHNQLEDKPYSSPQGLRACYDRVTERFQPGEPRERGTGAKRRGIGFAAHDWSGGGHPPGYAWVKLNADGSADVVTGTQDIGTGTRIGLLQMAAEELGMPLEQVTLHLGDTATGPYSPVSSGSATQATIGPAIRAAAIEAREKLLEAAAAYLEARPEDLSVRDGKIHVAGGPADRAVPIGDVTGAIGPYMILGQGARDANPEDVSIRTFGAQWVEVEVDTETGEVTVLRVVAAHDCGRVVNPEMVDSQVIGAVTQGIGFALMEDRMMDMRIGHVLNANLEEYKVPTVADVLRVENINPDIPDLRANPTGIKGIGEPPLIPTAPAIANAVYDAIGVRIVDPPITRDKILGALAVREATAS